MVRGKAAAGGVAGPAAVQGRVLHLRQVRQGAAEEERGEAARSHRPRQRPRRRPRAARLRGMCVSARRAPLCGLHRSLTRTPANKLVSLARRLFAERAG